MTNEVAASSVGDLLAVTRGAIEKEFLKAVPGENGEILLINKQSGICLRITADGPELEAVLVDCDLIPRLQGTTVVCRFRPDDIRKIPFSLITPESEAADDIAM